MVSFSILSLSLTLACPNLQPAAPSVSVPALTKQFQPCMPTSRSQHNKALHSSFTRAQYSYRQAAIKELEGPLEEDEVKGLCEQNEVSKYCTAFLLYVVVQLLFLHSYHRSQHQLIHSKKRPFLHVLVEDGAVIVNPIFYLRSRHGARWCSKDPLKCFAEKGRNCKAIHEQQPFWKAAAQQIEHTVGHNCIPKALQTYIHIYIPALVVVTLCNLRWWSFSYYHLRI